jgi:exopolysaccharide biosynthesis polyprenyl glycosylphosphotransferase
MSPPSISQATKSPPDAKVLRLPPLRIANPLQDAAPPPAKVGPTVSFTTELLRAVDVAVAVTVLITVFALTNIEQMPGGLDGFLLVRFTPKNLALLAGFIFFWPMVFAVFGLYDAALRTSRRQEAVQVLAACSLGALVTLPFVFTSITGAFQLQSVALFWVCVLPMTLLTRSLLRVRLVPGARARNRQVLIVGSGPRALKLFSQLAAAPHARELVVGFVDSSAGMLGKIGQHPLGTLDELETILMRRTVDEVLITLPIKSCYDEIQEAIDVCERVGVEARYLADVFQHVLAKPRFESSAAVPLVSLKVVPDDVRLVVKRGIDIVASVAGLVLLAPVFLLIAVATKLSSEGPVIFAQTRYGYNKRLFRMYKFRTMVPDAEALQGSLEHLNELEGPVFKIKDDPRITPVGRFLRRTSLDELPQLLNVITGDMSLVGPRPLPMRDVQNFSEAWLMRRFSVVPGCTGLWQISGRSELDFDDWITLDLRYIDSWSLSLDFKILLRTLPVVLRGFGAT